MPPPRLNGAPVKNIARKARKVAKKTARLNQGVAAKREHGKKFEAAANRSGKGKKKAEKAARRAIREGIAAGLITEKDFEMADAGEEEA